MQAIELYCPYCGKKIEVEPPLEKEYAKAPYQVYCLPYTRDIGKFDPKPEYGLLSADCWSDKRIGRDYLSFIKFERFGILRIAEEGINVRYRVQKCTDIECQNLFDVFANYSDKTLEQIWPHLFSPNQNNGGIKPYKGENLSVRLVRSLGYTVKSNFVGALVFGVFVFLLGWLPYILFQSSQLVDYRLSAPAKSMLSTPTVISTPTTASSPTVTSTPTGLSLIEDLGLTDPSTLLSVSTFFLYLTISIGIIVLLLYFESYLSYIQNSTDFDELFVLKEPSKGLNFWRNYISSRFVGVQQQKGFWPQLTQSDIFAGGISVSLALTSWFWPSKSGDSVAMQFFNNLTKGRVISIFYISELCVWLFIIYLLSIAIFLSFSLSSYVLNGIRKIPMNITPFDNFSLARPLRILESYSINILLVCFILILLILSMSQTIVEIHWVQVWFELALALLFIAVGLGSNRNEYIAGAILYLLIVLYLGSLGSVAPIFIKSFDIKVEAGVIYSITKQIPLVDLRVLVLGVFLTGALAFQLYSADQYVNNILGKAKKAAIRKQKNQLEILQNDLDLLNRSIAKLNGKIIEHTSTAPKNKLVNEYQSQRLSVLSSIDTTLRLIDHVEKLEIKKNPFSNITKVLTPFVSSLFLALVQEAVFNFLFPKT